MRAAVLTLAILVVLATMSASAKPKKQNPNLIFILADDLNAGSRCLVLLLPKRH